MKQFKDYLEAVHDIPKEHSHAMVKWVVVVRPNSIFKRAKNDIKRAIKQNGGIDVQVEKNDDEEFEFFVITFKAHYKKIHSIQSSITPISGKYQCHIAVDDLYKGSKDPWGVTLQFNNFKKVE